MLYILAFISGFELIARIIDALNTIFEAGD
jgi:hypothetical protein